MIVEWSVQNNCVTANVNEDSMTMKRACCPTGVVYRESFAATGRDAPAAAAAGLVSRLHPKQPAAAIKHPARIPPSVRATMPSRRERISRP